MNLKKFHYPHKYDDFEHICAIRSVSVITDMELELVAKDLFDVDEMSTLKCGFTSDQISDALSKVSVFIEWKLLDEQVESRTFLNSGNYIIAVTTDPDSDCFHCCVSSNGVTSDSYLDKNKGDVYFTRYHKIHAYAKL